MEAIIKDLICINNKISLANKNHNEVLELALKRKLKTIPKNFLSYDFVPKEYEKYLKGKFEDLSLNFTLSVRNKEC